MLKQQNLEPLEHVLYTFSDSSWNNDIDSGRGTGCFLNYYMALQKAGVPQAYFDAEFGVKYL